MRKYLYRTNEGFSTIEAVVSMVILSIIIIVAFTSLTSLSFFSTWDKQTIQSSSVAQSELFQTLSQLEDSPTLPTGLSDTGIKTVDGVDYEYTVTTQPSSLSPNVLIVTVQVFWDSQRPRTFELKSYYALGGN